ncbi:WbuC family cupin fold metalloprotein [Niveibacterium terrae]|uniref:WbuC family cupin fold metalloprotein n=1 Tax=Niveibacterium terrae TaxID=3373598 RepID=UPI003A9478E7
MPDRCEAAQRLDGAWLAPALAAARLDARLRSARVLHRSPEEPVQRFFSAMQKASYVRPHRHPDKDETLIAVRGRFLALVFGGDGEVFEAALLSAGGDAFGFHFPAGVWHGLVALEDGSVFFEVKNGPWRGAEDVEFAPWASEEGSREAVAFIERLRTQFQD